MKINWINLIIMWLSCIPTALVFAILNFPYPGFLAGVAVGLIYGHLGIRTIEEKQ